MGSKREQQKWALESVQAKVQSYESLLERIITASSEDPSKFKLIEELITVCMSVCQVYGGSLLFGAWGYAHTRPETL